MNLERTITFQKARLLNVIAMLWALACLSCQADPLSTPHLLKLRVQDFADHTRITLIADQPLAFQHKTSRNTLKLILHHPGVVMHIPDEKRLSSAFLKRYKTKRLPTKKAVLFTFQGKYPITIHRSSATQSKKTSLYHLTLHVTRSEKPYTPRKPVIVIDPGHGGRDPGARSVSGYLEKDLTLKTALVLARILKNTNAYHVYLTRTTDCFVPLPQRVAFAQRKKADLLISLHADSHPTPETQGLSLYTLSQISSDQAVQDLVTKENSADCFFKDLSGIQDHHIIKILQDLTQRESLYKAKWLAKALNHKLRKSFTLLRKKPGSGAFKILQSAQVPSLLVEIGCLSHGRESEEMNTLERQETFSYILKEAIDLFFEKH